jgi:hypothetical protein
MNEKRTGKFLRQVEHIRGHLWHRYVHVLMVCNSYSYIYNDEHSLTLQLLLSSWWWPVSPQWYRSHQERSKSKIISTFGNNKTKWHKQNIQNPLRDRFNPSALMCAVPKPGPGLFPRHMSGYFLCSVKRWDMNVCFVDIDSTV